MKRLLILLLLALGAGTAQAALRVMACEPEWAALVRELAGDRVSLYTATTAQQDPHHVQARPSLVAAVRNADLLVCTGAELESGWLPLLQRQSGNPAVQVGQPGYFEAAAAVRLLEVPTRADRADGDIHAAGNPHIQTDPRNIARVAAALGQRLRQLDPAGAADYAAREADFAARWQTAMRRWETAAASLRGSAVVVQHKSFPYLQEWLGLREVAAIEPKPGIEADGGHLARLLAQLRRDPPRLILRAASDDGRASAWLAERSGLEVVVLPYTVGGSARATDLFGLFDDTVDRLLKALR